MESRELIENGMLIKRTSKRNRFASLYHFSNINFDVKEPVNYWHRHSATMSQKITNIVIDCILQHCTYITILVRFSLKEKKKEKMVHTFHAYSFRFLAPRRHGSVCAVHFPVLVAVPSVGGFFGFTVESAITFS